MKTTHQLGSLKPVNNLLTPTPVLLLPTAKEFFFFFFIPDPTWDISDHLPTLIPNDPSPPSLIPKCTLKI